MDLWHTLLRLRNIKKFGKNQRHLQTENRRIKGKVKLRGIVSCPTDSTDFHRFYFLPFYPLKFHTDLTDFTDFLPFYFFTFLPLKGV